LVVKLPKPPPRPVLDNTKGDSLSIQGGSETSLTKETVSHIYDLPMNFSPGVLCNSGGVLTLRMIHVQK
jgi:hypothetical protein